MKGIVTGDVLPSIAVEYGSYRRSLFLGPWLGVAFPPVATKWAALPKSRRHYEGQAWENAQQLAACALTAGDMIRCLLGKLKHGCWEQEKCFQRSVMGKGRQQEGIYSNSIQAQERFGRLGR